MFPALDLPTVKRRSPVRPSYFDDVEAQTPGYTAQAIATQTSRIYSRLRKRYAAGLPWGKQAPPLDAAGLAPPPVKLVGIPTFGALLLILKIRNPGALGAATFDWSQDGGLTFPNTAIATAPTVALGSTGLSALFPVGPYDLTNTWAAPTPVPEAILRWLTILVSAEVLERHGGVESTEPIFERLMKRVEIAEAELAEAANSQTGLFDLPVNDDSDTAISSGGPLSYSEAGPYTWTYIQERNAQAEVPDVTNVGNTLVGGK
jgi:hypothetical protein